MSGPPRAPLAAILTMVAAMAFISTQDTLAKKLMLTLAPVLILWTRYAVQSVLVGLSIWRRGSPQLFRSAQRRWQLARAALVIMASLLGYGALQRIPVAEFTAFYCLVPLAVTVIARFVMKEPVSGWGWVCLVGGLAGALLIVRPGAAIDPLGATLALIGVVCYTAFQTLTSYLARQDSPLTIQWYTSLLGFAVMSALVPMVWPSSISGQDLVLLVVVAAAGSYGQYFMVLAYSKAPASVISPYLYSAIGFSALGGWLVFDHLPDPLAVLGMGMIVGFGLLSGFLATRRGAA